MRYKKLKRGDTMISIELEKLILKYSVDRKYKKSEFLFLEKEKADKLYIVHSGKIKVGKNTEDGSELTFQIAKEGDIIGEVMLFNENTTYLTFASVLEDAVVGYVDKSKIERELKNNSELCVEYIKWMGENLLKTQTKIRDLIMYGKKGALYSTLIRMSNSYGKVTQNGIVIELSITNKELSDLCGTTRESVNRMLSELKKQNIISIKNNLITIHNLCYLRKEIGCDDCPFEICQI